MKTIEYYKSLKFENKEEYKNWFDNNKEEYVIDSNPPYIPWILPEYITDTGIDPLHINPSSNFPFREYFKPEEIKEKSNKFYSPKIKEDNPKYWWADFNFPIHYSSLKEVWEWDWDKIKSLNKDSLIFLPVESEDEEVLDGIAGMCTIRDIPFCWKGDILYVNLEDVSNYYKFREGLLELGEKNNIRTIYEYEEIRGLFDYNNVEILS